MSLSSSVHRLLDCCELNTQELDEETETVIRQVRMELQSRDINVEESLTDVNGTLAYLAEQIEALRMIQESLVRKVETLLVKRKQGELF